MNAATKPMKDDTLAAQVDRLDRLVHAAFHGGERKWAESLDEALAGVERALRLQMIAARDPEGAYAEVDETRPTLARQASLVREDRGRLLEHCLALRRELRRATGEFSFAGPSALRYPGAPGRSNETIPGHVGILGCRAEELCNELLQNVQAETHLVLESMCTDIGVCD